MLNATVEEILTKDNKAFGVLIKNSRGEETTILGEHIISNTGALNTYKHLLAKHEFDFLKKDEHHLSPNSDFFNIYVSLNASPTGLGFDGSNQWIFCVNNHNHDIPHPNDPNYPIAYSFSFPSIKAQKEEAHTMEIMTTIPYDFVAEWAEEPWRKRSQSYYELKEKMATAIFEDIEKRHPGFKTLVNAYDTSTPLTLQDFLNRKQGASYGVPYTTKRMGMKWLSNHTPIQNLFLSGQDAFGPGIVGAMMGGVGAAAKVLGPAGYPKIMQMVKQNQGTRPGHNTSENAQPLAEEEAY